MAAYASYQRESLARIRPNQSAPLRLAPARAPECDREAIREWTVDDQGSAPLIGQLVDRLADRIAFALFERLGADERDGDDWLDSRHAAEYLGVHRDTLRKLAAERAIPSEQDGPGCKLYFRRSDLDAWRRCGGRPRHLAASAS
jgi:excisionase family DNA binding protein